MMSHRTSVVVFVVSVIITASKCDQEENCDKLGIQFYEEIGCQGVYQNNSKCPIKYTCPDLSLSSEKCLFQKREYSLHEYIDNDTTIASCKEACYCNKEAEYASFTCARLDCQEYWTGPLTNGCYRTYELGKCCSVGLKCPKSEDVAKCEVDGKTYLEGQAFFPKNVCLECVCTKDFDGSFGKSYCRKRSYATQLKYSKQIADKCALVYLDDGQRDRALCCPGLVCPSKSDKIEQVLPQDPSKSDLNCSYGERELKYGEGFKRNVLYYIQGGNIGTKVVQCTCLFPPLVLCR